MLHKHLSLTKMLGLITVTGTKTQLDRVQEYLDLMKKTTP